MNSLICFKVASLSEDIAPLSPYVSYLCSTCPFMNLKVAATNEGFPTLLIRVGSLSTLTFTMIGKEPTISETNHQIRVAFIPFLFRVCSVVSVRAILRNESFPMFLTCVLSLSRILSWFSRYWE